MEKKRGEIRALYDWGIQNGLDKETCLKLSLRALRATLNDAQKRIDFWKKVQDEAEEEMDAIETASGIQLPIEEEKPDTFRKTFLEYVEGAKS